MCETDGNKIYTCTVCGDTKSEIVNALGHKWCEWEIIDKPTLADTGNAKRVCANDNLHNEKAVLPPLSNTDVWHIGNCIAPSETREGMQEYISEYGSVEVVISKLPPSKFSITYEDGEAVVSAPKAGNYSVIFALYKGGILNHIEISETVFLEAGTKNIDYTYETDSDSEIRVFLWNTVEDMIPLCK